MIVQYFLSDDDAPIYEKYNTNNVPRVGDMVYMEEIFFVESLVWYPSLDIVRVNLKDEPPRKAKVAEIKEDSVKLNDVKQAKTDSAKALKETGRLKRELSTVRQYLKSDKESKK